jgi:low temperature requirement protein LtrA
VPGLGRSLTTDWDVEGGHLAERCSLFIIIALGEAILDTGASFAEAAWNAAESAAFTLGFIGSIAMWWIYFDTGAERGAEKIVESGDPGRLARLAYTYLHLPIVAGIILAAVGNKLILTRPDAVPDAFARSVILAGPVIYLAGNAAFKHAIANRWPLSHLVGFALFVVLAAIMDTLPSLALAGAATVILIVVAIWETISLRRSRAAPTPP